MTPLKTTLCLLAALIFVAAPARALDPGQYDITVYANEDYRLNLTHTAGGVPTNLTGYTFRLQAKSTAAATPFVTFSSAVTSASAGQTRHWLTRAATAAHVNKAGVYDLMQIAPDGTVSYVMRGKVRIVETVTR